MPQVSVRPAPAPQQPPAASLSEPHSYPPAVPAATGQLSRSRMRPPAVAARTVCGLGGWCVRRGPRGPPLPPRARALRKVRGSRDPASPPPPAARPPTSPRGGARTAPPRGARPRALRPRAPTRARSRYRAEPQPPPRHPNPALASPATHPVPLGSLPQVSVPTRRRHCAPAAGHASGPCMRGAVPVEKVRRFCEI